ncbi:MAG TPA: hypothetical protein VFQ68_31215 [Streptosporangiaceae bacterium]|nr:hypothetical protein [Streptosporangiaceae bacterium]
MPRRARYLVPRGFPRRDEILAVCMVLAIGAHLLFAQLTFVVAVLFHLTTKVTRWRLTWLAIPVAAGLAWAAAGPRAAVAGYTAGAARVVGYLGDSGHQAEHLVHFTAAFAGLGTWLPRQLPLALLAGTAEAALAGWLSWLHTDEWELRPARPGLIVAARRAATARAIRAGGVAAGDGGCLGIASGSGARITLSWAEAAGSVSVCGSAASDVLTAGFQLVHAAIRRHKPVLAVDHTDDQALGAQLAAVCAAAGTPLLVFGPGPEAPAACYEPFRHGSPARRAALITAMLSWDGPGRQYRRSCLSYLDDVFELLDAAPGDPRVPVLDDVLHLLNPVALQARMGYVPAGNPRREVLAERIRVSAHLISAEPATIAGPARQLRELRESPSGRWLRPSADGRRPEGVSPGCQADIDLERALADRAVVLFRLGGPPAAESSAMLDRLICQDLLRAGATRDGTSEGDADGDGLIWLSECAALPRQAVTSLIARGRPAGLPVLAATTSAPVAADLADLVNVVIAHRMADGAAVPWATDGAAASREAGGVTASWAAGGAAASRLAAAADPATLRDGEFVMAVRDPPRLVPSGLLVPARVPKVSGDGRAAAPRRAWEGA